MPNAKRPAGPGKPINEQHDAVLQQEGLDELQGLPDETGDDGQPRPDPTTTARHAERAAHGKRDGTNRKS